MRRNKRNGQPDGGVCDVQHTLHSDELFVIRQHKRNGQPDQGVCDIRHAVHSDELFALRQENINGQYNKMCVIRGKQVCNQKCVRRLIITQTIASNKTYVICSVYTTCICHWGMGGHLDTPSGCEEASYISKD